MAGSVSLAGSATLAGSADLTGVAVGGSKIENAVVLDCFKLGLSDLLLLLSPLLPDEVLRFPDMCLYDRLDVATDEALEGLTIPVEGFDNAVVGLIDTGEPGFDIAI